MKLPLYWTSSPRVWDRLPLVVSMPLDDDVEAVVMVNGDGDSGDENEDEDDELNNSFPSILDHFKEKIST